MLHIDVLSHGSITSAEGIGAAELLRPLGSMTVSNGRTLTNAELSEEIRCRLVMRSGHFAGNPDRHNADRRVS
jgi:hypothetical protein